MKKNLASLGTALSRDEAKKVVGGADEETLTCSTVARVCCADSDCGTDCTCYKAVGCTESYCVTPWN